jgi:5'-nucleotidase (lipoprotein e(P4) family)
MKNPYRAQYRRTLLTMLLLSILSACSSNPSSQHNNLAFALAWKQTAAEYRALYHQGFNLARSKVEAAIEEHSTTDKPLAVVTDVDETVLLANEYWALLISQGYDFFDDGVWDEWVPRNQAIASPGAMEFLQFCRDNNVHVFYVTNRDQGERTTEFALGNLQSAGFPYANEQHLTVLRESSNKEVAQQAIAENFEVVALLGDNLNDFSRRYYSTDVDQRMELMEQDREMFGNRFILFPNPTDGHWVRAIFSESEPAPDNQNRTILNRAAANLRR